MPQTFTLSVLPHYDSCAQQYLNVISPNVLPQGPLRERTRRLRPAYAPGRSRLAYDVADCCRLAIVGDGWGCGVSAGRCKGDGSRWLTPDDVPDLLTYLLSQGYHVDTRITEMLSAIEVRPSVGKLLFVCTWPGDA
jgi:hypothetical protein